MRNFSFSKKTFLATALLPLFLLSACKPACDYECQRDKAAAEKLKRRNELDHRLNKVGYKQLYDPVAKKVFFEKEKFLIVLSLIVNRFVYVYHVENLELFATSF